MSLPKSPGPHPESGDCPSEASPDPAVDPSVSPELPLERSRFSRWLASFGLGEAPGPLLRPLKPPRRGGS